MAGNEEDAPSNMPGESWFAHVFLSFVIQVGYYGI